LHGLDEKLAAKWGSSDSLDDDFIRQDARKKIRSGTPSVRGYLKAAV
jgi:hypothetical protein